MCFHGRPRLRRWRRLHFHIFASFLLILVLSVGAALLSARWLREERNEVPTHISKTLDWVLAQAQPRDNAAFVALGEQLGLHLALFDQNNAPLLSTTPQLVAPAAGTASDWISTPLGWGLVLRLHDGRALVSVPINDPIAGRFSRFAVAFLVMLIVIGLGSYKLARRLSRRLETLVSALDRFGDGDLSARATLGHRHDEVGVVAERFNAAAERVEKLVAAERRMIANASHELRSPLARIRLALELARAAPSPELIDGAVNDIGELDLLVEDLLVGARLAARGPERSAAPVDLVALVREVAGDAPVEGVPELRLSLDERAVRRALRNLIDNASEHAGGVRRLMVGTLPPDGAYVDVADGGTLDEGAVTALFEPFAKRPGSRGTGLGLSLAREVARAHGGDVEWRAGAPNGSVFRLWLR